MLVFTLESIALISVVYCISQAGRYKSRLTSFLLSIFFSRMAQSEVASDKDIVMCRTAAFVGIDIFCGSGESIVEDVSSFSVKVVW